MSKTHLDESPDDINSALDDFIANKRTKPVATQPSAGVDLFGGSDQKKKRSLRQRIILWWLSLTHSSLI